MAEMGGAPGRDFGSEPGDVLSGPAPNSNDPYADAPTGWGNFNPNPGPSSPSGGWFENLMTALGKMTVNKGVQMGSQALKGGAPVAGLATSIIDAILGKFMGRTDEEINTKAGRGMTNMASGGLFGIGELLGTALQAGAKALGFENMSPEMAARIDAQRSAEQNTQGGTGQDDLSRTIDLLMQKRTPNPGGHSPQGYGVTQSDNPFDWDYSPDRQ